MDTGHVISAYLSGFTTAYFLITGCHILFLWCNRGERISRLLGCFFVYMAASYGKDVLLAMPSMYNQGTLDVVEVIDGWSAIWFACFVFELAKPGWVTLRSVVAITLPHALMTALCVLFYSPEMMVAWEFYLGSYGLAVLFVGYRRACVYIRYVKANYSNIDEIDISWVSWVYMMMFLTQLVWLLASIAGSELTDSVYYVMSVVFWQVVVVRCRRLRPVHAVRENTERGRAVKRSFPFADALERAMAEERLYLDPNLSLGDLTSRLGTNRTYLSNYFTDVRHVSFYDYVNKMRVEHAAELMGESAQRYTLDYIASQSGFNSVSTFRRAFRKFMGVNPGNYRSDGA